MSNEANEFAVSEIARLSTINEQHQATINTLCDALEQAGIWLAEVDNKFYVRGGCFQDLAKQYKQGNV